MSASEPPESWPERDHGGLIAEHVTLGTGAYRTPSGELKPTVSVELFTRNFDNLADKLAIKVHLELGMLQELLDVLPTYIERATQNLDARQASDND
ncbi:MAG: hypothetical protein JWO11_1658 [Nocardioides sp.]|nr:hypothetical protein [Nocardioides sp.]